MISLNKTGLSIWGAVLVCLLFVGGVARAATIDDIQSEITELEQSVESLDKKSQQYQSAINEKKKDINTLSNKVYIVGQNIKKLENDIYLTSQEIRLKNLLVESLEIEIDKIFLDVDQKKATLAGLIKAINDFDNKGIVEIFFGSDKLSDFFDQTRYLEVINENLNKSLYEVKSLKASLETKKVSSLSEKDDLQELKRRTSVQKYALDGEKSQKQTILNKTKGEEAQYQAMLGGILKQKGDLAKEIQTLEKEVERRKNFLYYTESGAIPPVGTQIFRWPENNPVLTQGYGMTAFARSGAYGGAGHNGVDMSSGLGSPIVAAADGEVLVFSYNKGWGNWIALKHSNGMVTLYAHMTKGTFRQEGEKVDAGDVIGYEGSTGFSTGSHLHFSVYNKFFTYLKGGQIYFNYFDGTLNPLNYL